jgi:hypothetical protein
MSKSRFMTMCVWIAVGAMAFFVQPVMAAKNVNITVTPSVSNGGVSVDINGVNAVYNYVRYAGQSINDTIPVQLCMTGYEEGWTSIQVTFGTTSGNLDGVILPGNQTFTPSALPDCRNLSITIATGPLSVGNYNANINLNDANPLPSTGGNKPSVNFADIKNIQIKVEVLQLAGSNVSCFLTDSDGLFLRNCTGTPVTDSGSDDARFAIVANKKNIQVSTNPGQFYFNFVWYNSTGIAQTVNVNFDKEGVIPQGANAIHSAVFSGDLSTVNPLVFDEANMNGIPDGSDDEALGIVVPAGSSLLVTYHLEWADKGNPAPSGIAQSCEVASQIIEVAGTVSGTGITTESCISGAYGYKK